MITISSIRIINICDGAEVEQVTQDNFLTSINMNVNRVNAYKQGHDGSDGLCDCIGQIIGAVRLSGEKWPWTHGSNYAARYRVNNQHYVSKANEQLLGDLVFKARNPGEAKYDLPSTYQNHPDQKDYYHVGVVTSVSPLVITHCTGVSGGIKRDSTLGAWHYTGSLNQIEGRDEPMIVDYKAIVVANTGSTVNQRSNPSTNAKVQKAVNVGTIVDVIEDYNDDWAKVNANGTIGFMMRKFLQEPSDNNDEQVALTLNKNVALALFAALQSVVKE